MLVNSGPVKIYALFESALPQNTLHNGNGNRSLKIKPVTRENKGNSKLRKLLPAIHEYEILYSPDLRQACGLVPVSGSDITCVFYPEVLLQWSRQFYHGASSCWDSKRPVYIRIRTQVRMQNNPGFVRYNATIRYVHGTMTVPLS